MDRLQAEREPVVTCDTLEVSNVPPNVTKDYLHLYFETPKSGGSVDCVKNITMVKPGVFHVQFTDAAGKLTSKLLVLFATIVRTHTSQITWK